MMRTFPIAILLATLVTLAGACRQSPPGRCGAHADCPAGRQCAGGVCVQLVTDGQLGSRCVRTSDCAAWAICADETCRLAPGFCENPIDCPAGQRCGADHVCAAPTGCNLPSDCAAWENCDTAVHTCTLAPGRCGMAGSCSPWQTCDATHTCVIAPNGCHDDTGCAVWQACVSYRCTPRSGRCGAAGDCQPWQTCDATNSCVLAPGRCDVDGECREPQTCSAHVCSDPDPGVLTSSAVLFMGTLDPAVPLLLGLAPLEAPGNVLMGFPTRPCCTIEAERPMYVSPDGGLVYTWYRQFGTPLILKFRRDSLAWDSASQRWRYPSDPRANDEAIPTPACTAGQELYWVMREGTGEIIYNCGSLTREWYVSGFKPRVDKFWVIAWNASGYFGGWRSSLNSEELVIGDPSGAEVRVTGLDAGYDRYEAWRAAGDGFYVVLHYPIAGAQLQLWRVANSGAATRIGIFPNLPSGVSDPSVRGALDSSTGAYYVKAKLLEENVVIKRTVAGEASFAYRQSSAPANTDWSADPASRWLFIQGYDIFVTPP